MITITTPADFARIKAAFILTGINPASMTSHQFDEFAQAANSFTNQGAADYVQALSEVEDDE